MQVHLLVTMWCILALCPVLLAAGAQTLTIDSQLGTSVEDCFERVSIGEQLPTNAIYRNVSELTTRECEQICKQDKQCQAYDYGVGAKGNATCDLSIISEKEIKEKNVLLRHPDYDVYIRRFQCEQSPPSPLQPLQDELPGEGPTHRPVFRPEAEDVKRPLSDDYLTDLRPFETTRPNDRPYPPYRPPYSNYIDRPDDYINQRPAYDTPPAYGAHTPQDIPFRPQRPYSNYSDPYDVLQFDGPRPHPSWRPDPNYPPRPNDEIMDLYGQKPQRPNLPPYTPEKPEFVYINRPNRRPSRPYNDMESSGYGNKPSNYPSKPNLYGQNEPIPPYKPNKPMDYPYRPHDRPSYDYNSQYASNYGQNQYNDNSIYLEIFDPPRPYKPNRPMNDRPNYRPTEGYGSSYGYGSQSGFGSYGGSHSNQNSYAQNSQTSYGGSSITQNDYNRPLASGHRPYRPQDSPSSGYGLQDSHKPDISYDKPSSGYGTSQFQDPLVLKPQKPAYGSSSSGYGSSQSSSSYGSSHLDQSYGSQTSGYGSSINQKPQDNYAKPGYAEKPSYDSNKPTYGAVQGSYGQGSYGNSPNDYPSSQGYGTIQSSYGESQTSFQDYHASQQTSYGSSSQYGGFQSGYGSQKPMYGKPPVFDEGQSYIKPLNDRPSYGNRPYDDKPYDNRPSYGHKPLYDNALAYGDRPSYNKPVYDEKPSYGSNRPGYGERPSYDNKPTYDKPSYDRPPYEKPSYGQTPSYDNKPYEKPSYSQTPSYEKPTSSYGQTPSYDNKPFEKPSSSYGQSSYDNKPNEKPSFDKPSYGQTPSYDNNRPDGELGPESDSEGYKNSGKVNQTGYNADKPDIKPVYEYELEKPGNVPSYIVRPSGEVITSRPVTVGDYSHGRPGYGREPPVSYKACFRRVLAGKRALRSFVRKVVPCERLEDCRRECAEERRFHCESFNYRLDPSFRGKGLCEMMTKPIEAFDIRRDFVEDKDYDFYELDRNSLEPYCPETLKGPGLLHSGFLSSKPDMESYQAGGGAVSSGGWDRNDWYNRGSDRTRPDDRRFGGGYGGGRRRYEDPFFVPYQIGVARSNDDQESWGQYGGSYGRSYYKDRNDYHKSISHWGLNELDLPPPPPLYGVRPLGTQSFNYHDLGRKVESYGYGSWKRGRFGGNSSGPSLNGLDYGESSYFKPPKPVFYESGESEERSEEVLVKECSSRRRPGMSLGSGAIRRSLHARTVVQCEVACFNEHEFKCVSYSYRYSNSHGSDNCFLSERPYRGLELSQDSGSDVYAMPEDHGCSAVSTKPFVESECFWHVRSGAAVNGAAVRAALTVAGLGACEAECIRAHAFFCRGFSFRFDSPTIGDDLENCILTSTPPTSLEAGRGLRSNPGHELYARGNYGRGCEPALYDDVQQRDTGGMGKGECYLQYDNAAKLIGTAVKGSAKVRDEQSCGKACTDAPFRCLSFSYNNIAPPNSDNCLLSEIRLFDLQRGVDYEHSTDDWLFAFDLFNGQCWRKVHGKEDYDQPAPELPRPLSPPSHGGYPSSGPSGPSGPSSSGHSGASGPSGPSGPTGYPPAPVPVEPYPGSGPSSPGYKPSYPGPGYLPAEPPGYLPKPSAPGYNEPSGPYRPSGPSGPRPSAPGYLPSGPPGYGPSGPVRPPVDPYRPAAPSGPYRPVGPPSRPYRPEPRPEYGPPLPPGPAGPPSQPDRPREEEPILLSWRHYTVSGFPCRQGTSCAQNQVAGHWSCEPEGGEIGAWDYCCAPTHRCGYSEGFHKPWCYVGPSQDQWRPCSEKYYPYHQHNIPHPSQGHRGPDRPLPPGPPGPQGSLGPPRLPGPPGPPPSGYDRPDPSYLPEADRRYWDDLYNNGPQAYYDKYGNPLPGYTRVPTADRPYIKYSHNYPRPGSGMWVPVQPELDPPVPGGLGAPRYWPVAYLHKESPPNTTYFKYNQTERPKSSFPGDQRPFTPTRNHVQDPYPPRNFSRDDYPSKDGPREPPRDFNRDQNRNFDREPSREDDRQSDRNYDRDQNRNLNREPSRGFDREPSREFDREPSREFDREPSRGFDREPSRGFDREPSRGFDREPSRGFDREPSRDFDRDQNRNFDREPTRGPDRDNSRDFGPTKDYDRELARDGDRDDTRDLPREPTRDKTPPRERPPPSFVKVSPDKPTNKNIDIKGHRDEKTRNITTADEDVLTVDLDKVTTTTTPKVEIKVAEDDKFNKTNNTEVESVNTDEKVVEEKELDNLKGIDDKIDDFSKSIEVLNIEDAKKGEKSADLRTLEAEERQIEAIGRLLASRRGTKLVLEKRSQKDLESKSIALDKDLVDFNFGNRFPPSNVERRGTVQRVTKEDLARERLMDKSLEVSETTFVRPPRVLSTTENIRKAIVNGKVFYSATLRDHRDVANNTNRKEHTNFRRDLTNSTRKAKSLSLRPLEDRAPSILSNANYGKKKVVRTRNVNPVRKVRRVYRRKYNPDEVRKRLLEREKSMKENNEGRKV